MYICTTYSSPVGLLTLASDGESIVGLWSEGQKHFGGAIADQLCEGKEPAVFDAAKKWLERYFSGGRPSSSELPLAPIGGAFRQSVWNILREIPYGELTTYGKIAKRLERETGKRASAQAVGGAVANNPIMLMIPCHRVVGADGSLTGFASGLRMKQELLALEGILAAGR